MAVAKTYEPLAYTSLAGTASSITVSSISQSYTDLICVFLGTTDGSADIRCQVNGNTGGQYTTVVYGQTTGTNLNYGIAKFGNSQTSAFLVTSAAAGVSMIEFTFPSYTGSSYKAIMGTGAQTAIRASMVQYTRIENTAAISSISIFPSSGNFATNASLTVYGIARA